MGGKSYLSLPPGTHSRFPGTLPACQLLHKGAVCCLIHGVATVNQWCRACHHDMTVSCLQSPSEIVLPTALRHILLHISPHATQKNEVIKAGTLSLCHGFWKLPPVPQGQRGLSLRLAIFPVCFVVSSCWMGSTGLCVCLYRTLGA